MQRRHFIAAGLAAGLASTLTLPAFALSKNGKFTGHSGHVTKGTATLNGDTIVLESNFDFDGAPDPRVGLGKNGNYIEKSDFAKLKSNKGKQSYKIPASLKSTDFDEIVIWCRKFNVPLGSAKLK